MSPRGKMPLPMQRTCFPIVVGWLEWEPDVGAESRGSWVLGWPSCEFRCGHSSRLLDMSVFWGGKIVLLFNCDANQREVHYHLYWSSVIVCSLLLPFFWKTGLKAITEKQVSQQRCCASRNKNISLIARRVKRKMKALSRQWIAAILFVVHSQRINS